MKTDTEEVEGLAFLRADCFADKNLLERYKELLRLGAAIGILCGMDILPASTFVALTILTQTPQASIPAYLAVFESI